MSTRAHRQPRVSALSGRHPAVPLATEALPTKLEMPGMPALPEIPAVQKLTVTVSRALADEARDAFWACRGDYRTFSAFTELEKKIRPHVGRFVRGLDMDLQNARLEMTNCWVNIMSRHAVHALHLHPLSVVSGTFYVAAPRGCSRIRFEDPRLDRFMGIEKGQFFLSHGGFVPGFTRSGEEFSRPANGNPPRGIVLPAISH